MKELKTIKEQLISQVQSQMGNLECVNTKELGEVIDMIKDLAEAMYYCEIYEQMEESSKKDNYYYTEYYPIYDSWRNGGRMYYPEKGSSPSHTQHLEGSSDRGYYTERDYPVHLRDEREGRSPIKRKMYMESKSMGHDSSKTMKELEMYMQELSSDMIELLEKASPEEKAIVQKKMNTLATKVQNV